MNDSNIHPVRWKRAIVLLTGVILTDGITIGKTPPPIVNMEDRFLVERMEGSFTRKDFTSNRQENAQERKKKNKEEEAYRHKEAYYRSYTFGPAPQTGRFWVKRDLWKQGNMKRPNDRILVKAPGASSFERQSSRSFSVTKGTQVRFEVTQGESHGGSGSIYWDSSFWAKLYYVPEGVDLREMAKLTFIKGEVTITTAGGKTFKGTSGTKLLLGDVITAGSNAVVELLLHNGHLIRMKPNTHLVVPDRPENHSERISFFEMLRGKIWSKSRGKGNQFKIKTPRAVAGVRGTEFLLACSADTTTVNLFEGDVTLTPNGAKPLELTPGQQARVGPNGKMTVSDNPQGNAWWLGAVWTPAFREEFNTWDEGRWEKWTCFSGKPESLCVVDGYLVMANKATAPEIRRKRANHCGITTRKQAIRMPMEEPLVLEVRTAGTMLEPTNLNIGLQTRYCPGSAQEAVRDPWTLYGPILKLRPRGASVWATKSGKEQVIKDIPVTGGARLVIYAPDTRKKTVMQLTDLNGKVLGEYKGRVGQPLQARDTRYLTLWGYGWPEGTEAFACIRSIWVGPLSGLTSREPFATETQPVPTGSADKD